MEAYRLLNLILLVHCLQVVKIDSLNSQFRLQTEYLALKFYLRGCPNYLCLQVVSLAISRLVILFGIPHH
jgi:hypothetical protein